MIYDYLFICVVCPAGIRNRYDIIYWFQMPLEVPAVKPVFKQTKCGSHYNLPNGRQAECDPDGQNPCCSDLEDGKCDNMTDCSCDDCVDYKRLYNDWRETGGKQKWRYDGRCGYNQPLPDGKAAECDPDSERPCCSSSWDGECGNTAEYCSCDDCVDYSILYRDWRKSDGEQRWRYDGRCGRNHLLLDNTPAGCDPEGESPCCSSSWDGECGNTAEYCSCDDCVDYRMIYKDWREMEGKQKWRYDGRCGTDFPLPDGTPSQCDPESEKPCCDNEGYCSDRTFSCLCEGCIDYRLVKQLTGSGANCTVARLFSGFLKYVCYDEQRNEFTYKCTASDVYYKYDSDYFYAKMFSKKCENDPYSYQSCGFGTPITNADVLCGGYICGKREENKEDEFVYYYFVCSGDECKYEKREECSVSNDTYKSSFCDGKCDNLGSCSDEGDCNGYRYGVNCKQYGEQLHLPAALVCNPDELLCDDGAHMHDCDKNTGHTCTHYFGKKASNTTTIVPLLNYTRCSVFQVEGFMEEEIPPYCLDYLDQTNCSDIERVGGYCEVGGFLASVSKFVVCYKFDQWFKVPVKICDDNLQNDCQSDLSTGCTIHKHRLCDGEKDCPDGNDEVHDICEKMEEGKFDFKCVRRFNVKHRNISFPSSWIMDGTVDCMEGEDEDSEKWAACKGEHRKVVLQGQKCQDAFRCLGDRDSNVPFDQLCDGVESCKDGGENEVCRTARDFPSLLTNVSYKNNTIRDVCLNHGAYCEIKEFSDLWGETDVFGVTTKNQFWVPSSRTNCSQLFGENYLYLSCMDLCSETDVKCPLDDMTGVLTYDSCPGQFAHRTYTIANNSFLVLLNQSDRGHYHQEFYQCNNRKCVEYRQVCDLVDDCGDMSDEINCKNHMICNDTINSTRHHFIALSQKCDGIYDCFDLSDECNDKCGREILGSRVLKIICWFMGTLAMLFNLSTVIRGGISIKECETENMLTSKVLMSLIAFGDFLIGLYLVVLSVYDSIIIGNTYCERQAEWLTGTPCLSLGVISTLGSQLSLFSMTVLSVIRVYGLIFKAMQVPGPADKKAILKVMSLAFATVTAALAIAVIPLVPSVEDYFVQGMYYDPTYKVFIGVPNKDRHIETLQAYYERSTTKALTNISSDLSWRDIGEKVDDMFTQDHGNLTRTPVHFYGNDGLCLFKYFVRNDDARRSRQSDDTSYKKDPVVWAILAVNFFCFIIISCCYIVINIQTKKSSQRSGQQDNPERLRRERAMQNKIMIIIATDFLCWVPFIAISALHSLDYIDASKWYANFAMTVLPLNSVINPLVYDKSLGDFFIGKVERFITIMRRLGVPSVLRGRFSASDEQQGHEPENIPIEIIDSNLTIQNPSVTKTQTMQRRESLC